MCIIRVSIYFIYFSAFVSIYLPQNSFSYHNLAHALLLCTWMDMLWSLQTAAGGMMDHILLVLCEDIVLQRKQYYKSGRIYSPCVFLTECLVQKIILWLSRSRSYFGMYLLFSKILLHSFLPEANGSAHWTTK